MPISNNIQVDVILSGASNTSVRAPSDSSQVSIGYSSPNVTVTQGAGQNVNLGAGEQSVNVGQAGIQGIQGPPGDVNLAKGSNRQLQYNRLGYISGAKTFLYIPETDEAKIDGGLFTVENATFKITGGHIEADRFVIKNINNTDEDLFRVDYAGNIAATANLYLTGDIVPAQSGVSDLGSHSKPFGELYLQGDSVNFVDANATIKANKGGFNFFVEEENDQGQAELKSVFTVLTGIGGSKISGIAEFVDTFKVDAAGITGMPYTGIKNNGIYIEQDIPQNSSTVEIDYGETLPYDPKVLCSMVPAEGSNELYFTFVENITTSSCKAVFSSKITQNGYKLNCFVSPRDI
tara:strand:- start:9317 stop:10360 length:1044 start_codon:yes stop_codon:yes gene_type:complete